MNGCLVHMGAMNGQNKIKPMHRMIERLKHEMHKRITYTYIFQIFNAFRHLNNYNYAYTKRIKNG